MFIFKFNIGKLIQFESLPNREALEDFTVNEGRCKKDLLMPAVVPVSSTGDLLQDLASNAGARLNKRRRESGPAAGRNSGDMKGEGSLSTRQSITTTLPSNNGTGSSRNSLNDSVHLKDATNRHQKIFSIDQHEKEVTSDVVHTPKIALHQSTTVDSLNTEGTTKYLADTGNVPGPSTDGESKQFVETAEFDLPVSRDTLTNISRKSLEVTTTFPDVVVGHSPVPDPAEHQDRKTPKFGQIKYASNSNSSKSIGNLKTHLNKNYALYTTKKPSSTADSFTTTDFFGTTDLYLASESAVLLNRSSAGRDVPWPVKKEAVMEGGRDYRGVDDGARKGGPLNFMFKQFLPNITLGAHILDDCDKDTYGLEMAVDFIKGEYTKFE
ncbi:hypothetical protein NQ315_011996 [Exocentrus adspersus]|uniref:Uncharacterized protein n=1 Tax=Exocentrus adspersus TaxID=1586481 RepID=A0AAV8W178_9CUCU|nr:hypothetical protein NQ315_011996 [Exocentrus adspersus]